MGENEQAYDRAFNLGADYRLTGRPRSDSPYTPKTSSNPLYLAFLRGWADVHKNWGAKVRGWPFTPLPPVVNVKKDDTLRKLRQSSGDSAHDGAGKGNDPA